MKRTQPIHMLILALLLALPLTVSAQVAAESAPEPLVIRSTGLLDEDGTALYSVLLASGEDDLTDLLTSAIVPEAAAFVEDAWTPEAAAFVGEVDGIVTWRLDELSANTIIGPFTFRAAFADEDAEMPLNVAAAVTTGDLRAEVEVRTHLPYPHTTHLIPRAETASISFDAAGTEITVPVGETGVWIRIPAGAVSEETLSP